MMQSFFISAILLGGVGQAPSPTPAQFDKAVLLWTIPWDTAWITSVAFAGSAKRLVAGNMNGEIFIWDLPAPGTKTLPPPTRRLDGQNNAVTGLAMLPDGRWLISTSYDGTVRWWDLDAPAKGKAATVLDPYAREKIASAAKKSGGKAASLAPPFSVEFLHAAHTAKAHTDWIRDMCYCPKSGKMLTGDDKGKAILWDVGERKELWRLSVPGWLTGVALSPDAQSVVTCEFTTRYAEFKNSVRVWDVGKDKARADLTKECPLVAVAAFSVDGKRIAAGQGGELDNAKIFLFDADTGKKIRDLAGHKGGVNAVYFHPDGRHLLSCGRDTVVKIWQLEDGKLVKTLGTPRGGQFTDWIHAAALSPDNAFLATGDMAGFVHVWSLSP